ncbi:MAG TPA: dihydrolipoyl dehydrogenase [Polyangiaceae bacterium]|nr:dihydrolipoyl dehydrogenase [Polyangiaceae bacterium]
MPTEFDAIVLGGGPGGYPCAIRLGQLGQSVACIEEEEYGGVCLNWGCIPSKALISNAHLYHKAQSGSEVGLSFGEIKLDVTKMQSWKDGIVKKLTTGVRGLLKANGASVIEGRGRLLDAHTVEVEGKGGKQTLTARKAIVIATGSATIQVPGFEFDGKRIIGARQAVSLPAIPQRLLVVGGGVIGLELGMVYQSFGAELTVVELTPSLLPGTDPEAVKVVEKTLKKRGAKIFTETRAEGYELGANGVVRVKLKTKTKDEVVECDQVLVAVGMKPRSRELGLEALGVQIDPRGFIQTNDVCQTNVPGIYAIGDVSGPPMLAHKATKEGEVCAEVIAGHKAGKDWTSIPGIIFTDPEIATAGMSEAEATKAGHKVKLGKFPFSALGRAMSIRETEGFVKVVMDAETKRVLGVTMVGPAASDLISEAMLAVEMTASAEDLALTVHPHPTLGEALMEAGAAALGQAIHIPNR